MNHLLNRIQNWTQNGPMGNAKQYLPLIMGGISALAGWGMAQKAANSWEDIDIQQIKDDLAPSAGLLGEIGEKGQELWGKAQDMWDPRSEYNQTQRNYFNENSQDTISALARNQGRMQGSTGGQVNQSQMMAQDQNINRQSQTALGQNWQQYLKGAQSQGNSLYGMGGSLLGQQLQGQQQYDSIIANAGIQNTSTKNQFNQAIWGGASQGMFSMIPSFGQGDSGWWQTPGGSD